MLHRYKELIIPNPQPTRLEFYFAILGVFGRPSGFGGEFAHTLHSNLVVVGMIRIANDEDAATM